jgi:type I restriction-modification system DNA methylase subunit
MFENVSQGNSASSTKGHNTLPDQLLYSTQIPICLWFLEKNNNADAKRGFRDRLEVDN